MLFGYETLKTYDYEATTEKKEMKKHDFFQKMSFVSMSKITDDQLYCILHVFKG